MQDNPDQGGLSMRADLTAMHRIGYGLGEDVQGILTDALRLSAALMRPDGRESAPPALTAAQPELDLRLAAAMTGLAESISEAAVMYRRYASESDS